MEMLRRLFICNLFSFSSFLSLGEVKSVFPEKNDVEIKGFIRQKLSNAAKIVKRKSCKIYRGKIIKYKKIKLQLGYCVFICPS